MQVRTGWFFSPPLSEFLWFCSPLISLRERDYKINNTGKHKEKFILCAQCKPKLYKILYLNYFTNAIGNKHSELNTYFFWDCAKHMKRLKKEEFLLSSSIRLQILVVLFCKLPALFCHNGIYYSALSWKWQKFCLK